jgi:lysozyme
MRLPARQRHLSDEGLELIARFEGWVPYAYNDAAMHATVGFGHLIHHGPVTAADAARYGTRAHPKLSRKEGLALLRRDARAKAADPVRRLVKVPLTQAEFDALVSLTFNVGPGAFASSTVLRELNRGRRWRAGLAFLLWNQAGGRVLLGLSNRRRAERRLFRRPMRRK